MEFACSTRGNASPVDKPRVFFTCHPADFDRYFTKVRDDILRAENCAIYYTEDMDADLSDQESHVDLSRMNLFVIPITRRLLEEPNRAMDSDFPFAQRERIPVLPLMMEPGLEGLYSDEARFGTLQFINPYSVDATEIGYEEKLKGFLDSVLIGDEQARRIRAAFDAYIFLSYRKKDRAHANELMRLIHANPECSAIAIWFDEFLTPGESFSQNIERMLERSDLFALLVTPNLLERPDGRPNFVMAEEYPAARQLGKTILPAEMVSTDAQSLQRDYEGLPDCVDAHDEPALRERLLESIQRAALAESDSDPTHNYLIGLAYLNGIDVERDADRALELIQKAARSKLVEAMAKLVQMYWNGEGVERSAATALQWQGRLVSERIDALNASQDEGEALATFESLMEYGDMAASVGDYETAELAYSDCYDNAKSLMFGVAKGAPLLKKVGRFLRGFVKKSELPADSLFLVARVCRSMLELGVKLGRSDLIDEWQRRTILFSNASTLFEAEPATAANWLSLCALLVREFGLNGDDAAAEEWLERGVDYWSELDDESRTFEVRLEAAHLYEAYGVLFDTRLKPALALRALEERREILESLRQEFPEALQPRYELIRCDLDESRELLESKDVERARAALERAEAAMGSEHAGRSDAFLGDLIEVHAIQRARVLMAERREDEAIEELRRAIEPIASRLKRDPNADDQRILASVHLLMGNAHFDTWRFDESIAAYRKAERILEDVISRTGVEKDIRALASVYREAMGITGYSTDAREIEEWNAKALWIHRRILRESTARANRRKGKSGEDASAADPVVKRDASILRAIEQYQDTAKEAIAKCPVPDATLASLRDGDWKAYCGYWPEDIEQLVDAFSQKHGAEEGKAELRHLRDMLASITSVEGLVESPFINHLQLAKLAGSVTGYVGDDPSPLLRYDEEAMILYYLCAFLEELHGKRNKDNIGFINLLIKMDQDVFWAYPMERIRYPRLWISVHRWIELCIV